MQEVKKLIDEYSRENQILRQQLEGVMQLLLAVGHMHQKDGKVRIAAKDLKAVQDYTLGIKPLKSSYVLTIKRKEDDD